MHRSLCVFEVGSGLAEPILEGGAASTQRLGLSAGFFLSIPLHKSTIHAGSEQKKSFCAMHRSLCVFEVGSGFEPPYEVLQTSA